MNALQSRELTREIEEQLGPRESARWVGQPRQGFYLRSSDAAMIPFSLMWGGFAIFWEFSVTHSNAPLFFDLWGVPLVLMGIYMIVGRFFYDAWQRAKTIYALTDERVILISGIFQRKVQSLQLRTLPELSFTSEGQGRGTIVLGTLSGPVWAASGLGGWPGPSGQQVPRLESIDSARQVFEAIRSAQKLALENATP